MPTERMINYDNPEIAWVTSEPGDATRYSYGILKDESRNRFLIVPGDSTFALPKIVEDWEAVQAHADTFSMTHKERATALADVAEDKGCNPFTYAEVIMGIASLDGDYLPETIPSPGRIFPVPGALQILSRARPGIDREADHPHQLFLGSGGRKMSKWKEKDLQFILDDKYFPECINCGGKYFHKEDCFMAPFADRSKMTTEQWKVISAKLDERLEEFEKKHGVNGCGIECNECSNMAVGKMHVLYHHSEQTADEWPVCMDHAFHEDSAGRECQFRGFG